MKPRLYLHIGHSKVASTSIQDFLDVNLPTLRQKGFLVADLDFRFPSSGSSRCNPVGALETLCHGGPEGQEALHARLRELHHVLTVPNGRFDRAILSAENLCNPPFAGLFAPVADLFDVHLIYYVRRQDEWLLSAWKQWGVKAGKSVDEFCLEGTRTRYPAFTVALKRWEPLASHLHVRPLHPSTLADRSVTHDFARAIGLDPQPLVHPGIRNASFDAAVLEVLHRNPWLFAHRDDDRVFDFLTEFLPQDQKPARTQLDRATRQQLVDYFADENRALLERFCKGADYEVVFGMPKDDPKDAQPATEDLLMRFLGLQLRGLMDLHARVKALETEPSRQPSA